MAGSVLFDVPKRMSKATQKLRAANIAATARQKTKRHDIVNDISYGGAYGQFIYVGFRDGQTRQEIITAGLAAGLKVRCIK